MTDEVQNFLIPLMLPDITKPQPQLYVTPNFAYLNLVLEELIKWH
jgi:phenylalanine-4-hydroxylase